jgi:hypothetical protein
MVEDRGGEEIWREVSRDFAEDNPGSEYWDVFALDVYDKSWSDGASPAIATSRSRNSALPPA